MLSAPSPFREALRPRLLASVFGASLLVAGPALAEGPALPSGGSVAAGVASIASGDSGVTVTQSTNRAVVNWNSFSVGQGRTVAFDLPGANAAVLNRVTGDLPSSIAGALTSNGRIFLVNPNGVAITATGQVRVGGGFTASTLDISNADFMAGRLVFTGASRAEVSNAGAIYVSDGGQVALIGGGRVRNTGLISAPLGQVALGSGSAITLDPGGDGFLQILAPPVLEADGGVEVGGQVLAAGGRVVVRADAVERTVRDLVNLTGEVSVASARSEGGSVILDAGAGGLAASGRIDATSGEARGGRIALGGDSITLSGARLDAGGASGGEITVGGGWQGAPVPGVTTARSTQVDAGSRLEASGSAGAGGRVILWSDDDTRFRGRILATGTGGDGGVAEVSSHGVYLFDGQVNLLSTGGKAGRLLLDPYNVTISTGADANQSGFTATGDSAVINVTSLQNALAGASVTVSTGSSGTQAGNITLSNALSWSADTTLTLNAAGAITLNAAVTNSGTGSGLELISPGTISLSAPIANSGTLTVNGAGTATGAISGAGRLVKTGAGTLTMGLNGPMTWTGATSIASGTLYFTAPWNAGSYAGDIDIASGATLSFWNGNQTLSGIISGTGTLTTSGSGGQVLTLTGQNTFNGTIQTGSYSVTIGGSGVLGGGNFSGSLVTNSTGAGAGGSFRYASTADQVISGPISGGGNVVKDTAASTLTLTGASTHSGGTTVSAGTLVFGGASTHSTAVVTINAGGTLRYSTSASQALNIAGAGALIKDTAPSTLSWGNLVFTGPITIDAGTIDLPNGWVFGGANAIDIGAAGTLRFSKWAAYTHSGVISGTGTLTQAGVTVTLTGANTFNGTINIIPTNQSLIIGGSGVLGGGNFSGAINNAGTFTYSSSIDQTLSGVISGGGGLAKNTSAASTLTLTGANTFTGGITNSAGTLVIGGSSSLGGGTYAGAISNAGTLRYSSSVDQTLSGVISGAGTLVKDTAASTLILSGANTYTGVTTLSLGTLRLTGANASSGISMAAGTLLDWANAGAVTYAGVLSGAGGFQKSAAGVLTLSGLNTFTSSLAITAGTLRISGSGSLAGGSYAGDISNAGTFQYGSSANQTLSGVLSGAGSLTKDTSAASTLILTGTNTFTGAITNSTGTFEVGGAGSLGGGTYAGAISNAGNFTYSSSVDQTLSGVISGVGTLNKSTAPSVLTLTGVNTYSGGTSIGGNGTLRISGTGSLGSGSYAGSISIGLGSTLQFSSSAAQTLSGAILGGGGMVVKDTSTTNTLILSGNNNYSGSTTVSAGTLRLVGSNTTSTINLATGTLLDYANTAAQTYAGVIAGAGAFQKSAAGVLTLTGASTFTGSTTITAGELKIGGAGTFGGGTYAANISNAGTLRYSSSADQVLSGVISGAGALIKDTDAASTLTLTGTNTFTGAITNTLGTLAVGGAGSLGSGTYAGAISNAGTLRYSSSADQTLSGVISGAGALVKDTAASTLILTGANTYTGATTLSLGTLRLTAANASSGVAISAGALLDYANAGAVTYAGVLSGAGALQKSAAGVLTLSGANTFTGGVTFAAGTLLLNSAGAIGSSGALAFSGGTLQHSASNLADHSARILSTGGQQVRIDTNGQSVTYATGIDGAGTTLNKLGTGTLTLSGTSGYTGSTTITAGELKIGGAGSLGAGTYAAGISNAGTLRYSSSANQTLSGVISGAGALIKDTDAASTLTLTGVNTFTGAITNTLGTLVIGGAGSLGSGTYAGAISNAGTLRYSSSADQVLSGGISGAGSVVKDTSATSLLTLSANNTFTGGAAINAGTVRAANGGAFGTGGAISFGGGTLQYSGITTDFSGRFLATGNQPIRIDTNGMSPTFGSGIAGTGTSLAKLGTGTLSLSAANTFTGDVTISGGELLLASGGSLGGGVFAGNVAISAGAGLNSQRSQTLAGIVSGTGYITVTGGIYTLTLTGQNTFNGAITPTGYGFVAVGGAGILGGGNYSGTLNLSSATAGFRYSSTASQVITSPITGSGVIVQDAAGGVLTLLGANTNTGSTTVSAGTLRAGAANVFSSASAIGVSGSGVVDLNGFSNTIGNLTGNGVVTNNGASPATLTINYGGALNNFSGSLRDGASVLSLTKTGSGTQGLYGANTYTGNTTISGGELYLAGTLGGGVYNGNVAIGAGAGLTAANNQTLAGIVSGTGFIAMAGGIYTLTLTGQNTFNGAITPSGYGYVVVGGAGILGGGNYSGTLTLSSTSGGFRYSSTASQVITSPITGSGVIVQDAAGGVLTLSGANTYTGSTTVSAGTLRAGAANAFSSASNVTMSSPGILDISGYSNAIGILSGTGVVTNNGAATATLTINVNSSNQTFAGVLQDGASALSLAKAGNGNQFLTGANTFTGGINVNGGMLALSGSGTLGGGAYAGNIAIASGAIFDPRTSAAQTLSGVISGAGSLWYNGGVGGSLTLTGVNTYTGPTSLGGYGVLTIGGAGVLGGGAYAGNIAIGGSSSFRYSSTADQALSGTVSGGTFTKDTAASKVTLTGAYTAGTLTVNAGEFAVAGAGTHNGAALSLGAAGTFRYSTSANLTWTGGITGTGTFIKDTSTSRLTLNNNFLHTGPLIVNAGTLAVGSSNFTANNLTLGPAGIFDFYCNCSSANIGVLSGSGTIRTDSAVTANVNIASGDFSGVITNGAGTVGLVKNTAGTLILRGASTFTGPITVNTGTLQFADAATLAGGAYAGNITNSGTLRYSSSADQTLSGVISGSGTLVKDTNASTLTLTGANTYSGALTISAGTLRIGGAGFLGNGTYAGAISNSGVFQFSSTAAQTLSGVISGTGTLVKDTGGSSTLILSGNNTYTGATTLSAGTLRLVGSNSTPTLNLATGTLLDYANTAAQTYAGVIAGAGAFQKSAAGVLSLTGASTFTGGTTITAGELKIDGAGSLGSGTYAGAISNAGTLRYSSSADQTLAGVISGAGTLIKDTSAASTLTLTGVNTFTGAITNTLGTLAVGGAGSLGGGTYAGAISNAGTLRYSSSVDQTLSGVISGAGSLVKDTAASTLILTGANIYTGATTLSLGTLRLTAANASSGVAISAGGLLDYANAGAVTYAGVISGAGVLQKSAAGVLSLTGASTFTGNTAIAAGELKIGAGSLGAGAYAGNISNAGTLRYSSSADQTLSGVISGAGTLIKDTSAASTLTLTGVNTFTGAITNTLGTLAIGGAGSLGGGTYAGAISNAGTLRYSSSADQTLSGVISGAGALVKDTAASTLVLTGANTYTGATTLSLGTLRLTAANASSGVAISAGALLDYANAGAVTYAGVLSGAGALQKSAAGVLTLSGANTFTGDTAIAAGELKIGAGSLGSGTYAGAISNAGTLRYSSSVDQTLAGVISGAGMLIKDTSAASTLTLTGVNTFTGAITNTLGTLAIGGAGSLGGGTYAGAISNAGTLRYSSSADQTLSGVISGAGGLAKDTDAASVLTLSGANTYTGATTFGAGVVQLGSAGALGTSGALAFSGGTLRHGAANTVDYSTRILSTGGQLVRIDTNGQAVTWASGLSGAGTSLTKLGAGTLDLTANSGFTGGLTISEGELRFSGAGALGGGTYAGAISNAGTLRYSSTADQTFSGALSGAGALVKDTDAAAILTLTGANTLTGPITIDAGTLRIGGSSVLGGGAYAGNLTNNGVLRYASSADQVLSGVISGTGSVVKDTSATAVLTLSGANTFGGQLKVDAGKVELEGSWSPTGGAASVRVGAGALLEGAGVVSAATLTLAGPGHVDLAGPNQVDAIAATGAIGGVSLVNARSLSAGSIQATDAIRLRATGASDIILSPGAVLESAATGDAVVLGAGRNFQNNSGAAAVATPAGRWLVYSSRPADNQFGGLNSAQVALWGRAPMAAVAETGNRYVFSQAPVLTVSTASFSKSFGQDISAEVAAGYSISGYDPGVSGAYLGDSFATALRGAPSVGSDGARADAPAGTYVVYASGGSLAPVTGYALAFNSTGLLTVDQAVLTVRARSVSKVYDGLSLSTGAGVDITGWIPGDGPSSLSGVLTYTGSFVGASDAGTYQIQPGGLTSQNYTVKFLPGTLTITPAPLTVTVVPVTRTYDGGAFSGGNVTYAGLVNGQSASVLGGALAFGGTAQGAVGAGTYTLTASGLSSGNYTISYVPGALTIRPAPLTVTAKDASRTYDATAWTGGAGVVIDGLVGKDVQGDLTGTLAYGGSSQGAVNAGTYDITVSGLSSPNYEIRYVGGRLVIQKSVVTVAADPVTKSFDGTPFTGTTTVTVTGLAGQDTRTVLTGELVFTGAARGAVEIGTYEIVPSGLTSQNYEIRYLAGILQVVPAPVTVTARPRLEYVCRAAITLLGEQACQPVDDYAGFVDEPRASVDLFVPPPSVPADGSPSSRMD